MDNLNQIKDFIEVADQAQHIVESEASWEAKFEVIFSDCIMGRIQKTDIEIDWCDPDTTYEEDSLAFVRALQDKARDLKAIWASLHRKWIWE